MEVVVVGMTEFAQPQQEEQLQTGEETQNILTTAN
jgi:hypothetical protein